MKPTVAKWLVVAVLVTACAPTSALAVATLRLVPSATTIQQGDEVTVKVFVEDLPRALKGYQVTLEVSGGTGGLLTLSPNPPEIFIDQFHVSPPWVLADWATVDSSPPITGVMYGRP